jgi:hypothetical protein
MKFICTVKSSLDATSIVVVGAMNPRIHQPHWYAATGIISAEELQVGDNTLIAVPRITQFSLDHIKITCQDDRWDLFSDGEESFSRAVEIASLTWNKLPETPVSSYGFNFFASFFVGEGMACGSLCSLLPSSMLELGFSPKAAEYKVIGAEDGLGQVTVDLRPSDQASSTITASINYHFIPEESAGYFDLGSALSTGYKLCLENAKKKHSIIANSIFSPTDTE